MLHPAVIRQGHGTQHAVFSLPQAWQKELNESGYSRKVPLDLSKAYDCLSYDLIIAKLEAYGFDSMGLKFFHSYFTNRIKK